MSTAKSTPASVEAAARAAGVELRKAAQAFGTLGEPADDHDWKGRRANDRLQRAAIAFGLAVNGSSAARDGELQAARELLREIEWGPAPHTDDSPCPWCLGDRRDGHADHCEIGRYLSAHDPQGQPGGEGAP